MSDVYGDEDYTDDDEEEYEEEQRQSSTGSHLAQQENSLNGLETVTQFGIDRLEWEDEEDQEQQYDRKKREQPQHAHHDPYAEIADAAEEEGEEDMDDEMVRARKTLEQHIKRGSAFLTYCWDSQPPPSLLAPNGFIHPDHERLSQDKTYQYKLKSMFEPQKSQEVSAQLVEAAGRKGMWEKIVELSLIRDTFEPWACNINFAEPANGETPLMRASSAGLLDVVKFLHEASFNWALNYPLQPDSRDFLGATALMKAAQHGHLLIVKYLLEVIHASIELKDFDGWSALMFAAAKGHWHIVEYIVLVWDGDVLDSTLQGDTPLMLAANNGYLNIVRFLVEETAAGQLPDEIDMHGHHAQLHAHHEDLAAQSSLAIGLHDDIQQNQAASRPPPLHVNHDEDDYKQQELEPEYLDDEAQMEWQNAQQSQQYIRSDRDILGLEQVNARGWSALVSAAHYGQLYVVHYLVSKGANPDKYAFVPTNNEPSVCARSVPLSVLVHSRPGAPVNQTQVLGAIDRGLADREKQPPNKRRSAVNRAVLRFKRAERFLYDAEIAKQRDQYEAAYLLYTYAFFMTRSYRLLEEEFKLKEMAQKSLTEYKKLSDQHFSVCLKFLRERLSREAKSNYQLAENYMQKEKWKPAIMCLKAASQYDREEPLYKQDLEKANLKYAPKKQSIANTGSISGDESSQVEGEPEPHLNEQQQQPENKRQCAGNGWPFNLF